MSKSHSTAYAVDLPYPEVNIDYNNPLYASLLLDDYASSVSELTAITQYVYAHILAIDPEVSDTFLGVGIVEMHHLDMLGDVITELGYYPKFKSGCGEYWNASYVPYGSSTRDRLQLAINSEKEAIAQYRNHIKIIKDPSIDALLERIILDEELHIKIFTDLLCKY